MLSLRVSREEKEQLKRVMAQRSCTSLSDTLRVMCGFPRTGAVAELEGADDIESVSTVASLIRQLIEREDRNHQMLTFICRHLEIPLEARPRQPRREKPAPPEKTWGITTPERQVAVGEGFAHRGGHQHPELPDGFVRG